MKTSITGALAFLLFAGVSTAALAQEHDHDRDRGGGQPQAHQGGPPQAAPAVGAKGGGAPAGAPGQGHARFGAPPGGGAAPAERRFQGGAPGDQRFQGGAPGDHRFQGGAPADRRFEGDRRGEGDRRFEGERHFQGGNAGVPPGDRRFDRNGAPREVIPPGRGDRGDRGFDREHDGHAAGPGRWNGAGAPHWNRGEHWERGRMPPVFWSQHRFHLGAYRAPYGFYARDWAFGDFLPRGWFGEGYWVGDYLDYDLPYPPPGYVWVRVGGDAIMVDRFTGRIVQVVRGIFY